MYAKCNNTYYESTLPKLTTITLRISFNWVAFLGGPFWLAYRKMDTIAYTTIALIAFLLLMFGLLKVPLYSYGIICLIPNLILGIWGNYIYSIKIKGFLQKLETMQMDDKAKLRAIQKEGGISSSNVISLVFLGIFLIGIIIPSYTVLNTYHLLFSTKIIILTFTVFGLILSLFWFKQGDLWIE